MPLFLSVPIIHHHILWHSINSKKIKNNEKNLKKKALNMNYTHDLLRDLFREQI
jgi:hypothetical protein